MVPVSASTEVKNNAQRVPPLGVDRDSTENSPPQPKAINKIHAGIKDFTGGDTRMFITDIILLK
jgi:hypothetical protein